MRFVLFIFLAFGCIAAAHAEPAVPGSSGATGDAAARLLAVQTVLQASGSDPSPLSAAGLSPAPQAPASAAAPPPTMAFHGGVGQQQHFLPLHPPASAIPAPPRGSTAATAQALRAMITGSASAQDLGRTALAAAHAPSPAAAARAQMHDYMPQQIRRAGGDANSFAASTQANAAIVEAMHQYRLTHGTGTLPATR
jgi:hypothetical protein